MPQGGFLVKFDNNDPQRCYAVEFDYDEWFYAVNNRERREIPKGVRRITIQVEES